MSITKTSIHYRVSINNYASLAPEGYSEYYNRLRTHPEEAYGPDQAREHIKEYFATQDEYTEARKADVLTIQKVTTIVETLEA